MTAAEAKTERVCIGQLTPPHRTKRLFRSAANFDIHDNRPKMADLKSVFGLRGEARWSLKVRTFVHFGGKEGVSCCSFRWDSPNFCDGPLHRQIGSNLTLSLAHAKFALFRSFRSSSSHNGHHCGAIWVRIYHCQKIALFAPFLWHGTSEQTTEDKWSNTRHRPSSYKKKKGIKLKPKTI